MVFFIDYATDSILPIYALHAFHFITYYDFADYTYIDYEGTYVKYALFNTGLLSPVLIMIGIPLCCVLS